MSDEQAKFNFGDLLPGLGWAYVWVDTSFNGTIIAGLFALGIALACHGIKRLRSRFGRVNNLTYINSAPHPKNAIQTQMSPLPLTPDPCLLVLICRRLIDLAEIFRNGDNRSLLYQIVG